MRSRALNTISSLWKTPDRRAGVPAAGRGRWVGDLRDSGTVKERRLDNELSSPHFFPRTSWTKPNPAQSRLILVQ